MYLNGKLISTKHEMPKTSHFAILKFDSVYIPGDERSRTHPGHGYPGHSQAAVKYYAYTSQEAWQQDVGAMSLDKSESDASWVALKVDLPEIAVQVSVK